MEQKFDATPKAELRLRGRTVTRSDVANDWGLQLRWVLKRDGKVIANPPARADYSYEHPDTTPGERSRRHAAAGQAATCPSLG